MRTSNTNWKIADRVLKAIIGTVFGSERPPEVTNTPSPPDAEAFLRFDGFTFYPDSGKVSLSYKGREVASCYGPKCTTIYDSLTVNLNDGAVIGYIKMTAES